MIAVDTNLLVYSHREGCAEHGAARRVIEQAAVDPRGWGIPAPCLLEFWSVVTHPASSGGASSPSAARQFIEALMETGGARIFPLPPAYALRALQLSEQLGVRGPRAFDLQIGLAAIDAGVTEIWTHDAGFIPLPGIRVSDPLAPQ
jgi:uncharacterized protein